MMNQSDKHTYKWSDYLVHGIYFLVYAPFKYFPSPIGNFFRKWITWPFCPSIRNTRLYEGVTVWYPNSIQFGKNVSLNEWVYLSGIGGLTIGDNVRIGARTTLLTSDHNIDQTDIPITEQGVSIAPTTIGSDVWLGCNVTILKGVSVGEGSVVAAGAVVNNDVEPYSIVGGVPAKLIKRRK